MKKTLLLIALLLPITFAFSQQLLPGQLGGTRNSGLLTTSPVVVNESIDGTPYINEKYLPASISASEGNVFYVRYNAMRDQFEVMSENNKAYYLNRYRRDIVIEIIPLNKTYQVFGALDEDGNENFGYFVYLTNGNAKNILFKKEKVTFIGEKLAVTSYDTARSARYKRWNDSYYIKKEDKDLLVELPTGRRAFAKLFPDHEKQIFNYMKENRLRPKREDDLIRIVNYINTL